jgi:hypothetical protein
MKRTWLPGFKARGTSFLETTFYVVLLVLTAGMVVQLVTTSETSADRFRSGQRALQSELDRLATLPRLVREVRPPVWAPPTGWVTQTADRVTAGYYGGDPGAAVEFRVTDQCLSVSVPGRTWVWGPFEDLRIFPWVIEGRTVGLGVGFRQAGETRVFRWAWGSEPL